MEITVKSSRKQRKTFSKEFKTDAVNRSCRVGIRQTCLDLEIGESTLQRWRKENGVAVSKESSILPENGPTYKELESENIRLKKELSYVSEINRILKKSTAIFLTDQMGFLK